MEEEKTVCSSNLCCGLFLFLFLMAVTGGTFKQFKFVPWTVFSACKQSLTVHLAADNLYFSWIKSRYCTLRRKMMIKISRESFTEVSWKKIICVNVFNKK